MNILKQGSVGEGVLAWQKRLGVSETGTFDTETLEATRAFQRSHGLTVDGVVGPKTWAESCREQSTVDDSPPTGYGPLRDPGKLYGHFRYTAAPIPGSPENINVLDGWIAGNIVPVMLPALKGVMGAPASCRVYVHRLVAGPIQELFDAWSREGLSALILTWGGSFCPRFVRGNASVLSNHAYGSAFDINVQWNALGREPMAVDCRGSVRELVPAMKRYGWWWGGWGWGANSRKDGMHVEWAGPDAANR